MANGQAAELVLGQASFDTSEVNHGGLSAASLNFPSSLAVSEDGTIWGLDSGNCRVLQWNSAPAVNFQASVRVVGAPDFITPAVAPETGRVTASTFFQNAHGIAVARGKLIVSDRVGNRVLVWAPIPTADGQPASIVLGQADFTGKDAGAGASDFSSPEGIWTDGTRLVIADGGNNRVLIWTAFPTGNRQPASLVLGQPDFGVNSTSAPSATSMHAPTAVHYDGMRFFVADQFNARILVWNSFPTRNGQPADFVIGQSSLSTGERGAAANQLGVVADVLVAGNSLFVSDYGNSRVVVYSPVPTTSGVAASFVLGAPDFSRPGSGTVSQVSFSPAGLAVQGHALYVVDPPPSRILRFRLNF